MALTKKASDPQMNDDETKLSQRERILLDTVDSFYNEPNNFKRLKRLLSTKKPAATKKHQQTQGTVSLRLLDFLCTTYATRKPIVLQRKAQTNSGLSGSAFPVDLKDVYQNGLNAYGKAHYDCFRRNKRLVYQKHGKKVITTLGQLLYFKDALTYGIVDYAEKNQANIKRAMAEQAVKTRTNKAARKSALLVNAMSVAPSSQAPSPFATPIASPTPSLSASPCLSAVHSVPSRFNIIGPSLMVNVKNRRATHTGRINVMELNAGIEVQ